MTEEVALPDWNPNDPLLEADNAPHETAGVMRWHRAKVPSKQIMQLLHLRGTQLIATLEKATKQESQAAERGLEIHDPLLRLEDQ